MNDGRAPADDRGHQGGDRTERPTIAVLYHHRRVPLGVLKEKLAAEADLIEIRGYEGADAAARTVSDLTQSGAYDGVVALGGPQAVYERAQYPFLDDSIRLLEDAIRRDLPVLGLCLGSQLVAEAAGAVVFPGDERGLPPEVGFYPLHLTEEGARDPVLAVYGDADRVLFWHRDTHDLPPGALLLAATDAYPVTAYRIRARVYGIQFHLESTAEVLEEWARESPLPERAGVEPWPIVEEAEEREEEIRRRGFELAGLFALWARVAYEDRISRTSASASSAEEA